MLFFVTILLVGQALAAAEPTFTCPESSARSGCLTSAEAKSIVARWPLIYDSIYNGTTLAELINCTVSEHFHALDRTFTFGNDSASPYQTTSREALYNQSQLNYEIYNFYPQYSATAKGGSFTEVFMFFGCNEIAWRWNFVGTTSGKHKCTMTTNKKAGLPIHYYGTDLLIIQSGTTLIEKVVTSADWINDFLPIGADFRGSSICPGTTAPAPNPACG